MTTYKAIVDLVVAGKPVKAGSTFEATADQVAPAVAFGVAEIAKEKPKQTSKRSTRKAS